MPPHSISGETMNANGNASTVKKLFSRSTTVTVDIAAPPARIWELLTDSKNFASWNSTIVELTGDITPGGRIQLVSKLDPKRTFKLKVKEYKLNERLSWGDAMGTRVYTLTTRPDGSTQFQMTEKIGGPIFPLFAKMIPPFDSSFNQFAADLKLAAEEKS
ncbi:MAG: SRPBCC domain-containing protein [Fuerstiella sp.]